MSWRFAPCEIQGHQVSFPSEKTDCSSDHICLTGHGGQAHTEDYWEAPMPISSFLTVYLLLTSLALALLAGLLYHEERHKPELQGSARVLVSLGIAALACVSLAWIELRFASLSWPSASAPVYVEWGTKDSGLPQ